ncbi:MAG: Hpt domain-containing protein [Sulfurovum sp.]|nr:Hpt domain-containing protein [Sulfurovum sp.]
MFFIVNHENYIIAADADFLEEVGAKSIYEIASFIQNGKVQLDELELSIAYFEKNSSFSKVSLSTFLGDAYLYRIQDTIEDEEQNEETISDDELLGLLSIGAEYEEKEIEPEAEESEELVAIDENNEKCDGIINLAQIEIDEPLEVVEETSKEEVKEDDSFSAKELAGLAGLTGAGLTINELLEQSEEVKDTADESLDIDNDDPLISLKDDPEVPIDKMIEDYKDDNLQLFPDTKELDEELLGHPIEEDKSEDAELEEKELLSDESASTEVSSKIEHHINIGEISALIGVSQNEYTNFLEDLQKESSQLEPDLRNNDLKASREAISILKEASLLLHLPHIAEKLSELSDATSDEKDGIVNDYLMLVSGVNDINTEMPALDIISTPEITHMEEMKNLDKNKEEVLDTVSIEEEAPHDSLLNPESSQQLVDSKGINLDHIQALPFDFSINEAADDLTLPVSLVGEFIIDFINQGKENLPVLQKAYEDKDLDTLQKTAHMLKGASSNLRITPMADTLYGLQFNDDISRVPELIKQFAGQLKALSIQMNQE